MWSFVNCGKSFGGRGVYHGESTSTLKLRVWFVTWNQLDISRCAMRHEQPTLTFNRQTQCVKCQGETATTNGRKNKPWTICTQSLPAEREREREREEGRETKQTYMKLPDIDHHLQLDKSVSCTWSHESITSLSSVTSRKSNPGSIQVTCILASKDRTPSQGFSRTGYRHGQPFSADRYQNWNLQHSQLWRWRRSTLKLVLFKCMRMLGCLLDLLVL